MRGEPWAGFMCVIALSLGPAAYLLVLLHTSVLLCGVLKMVYLTGQTLKQYDIEAQVFQFMQRHRYVVGSVCWIYGLQTATLQFRKGD